MNESGMSSGPFRARSVQGRSTDDPAWMKSPWTAVAFTAGVTIIGMMLGKAVTAEMGWSPIWAFPFALVVIIIGMWGLARSVKRLRRAREKGDGETPLNLAA